MKEEGFKNQSEVAFHFYHAWLFYSELCVSQVTFPEVILPEVTLPLEVLSPKGWMIIV